MHNTKIKIVVLVARSYFANAIDVADLMWNPQRDLLTNTNSKQRATEQPIQMVINRLLSRFLLASPSSRLYKREHVCPGTCLSSSQLEEKNIFLKIFSETFSYKYVFYKKSWLVQAWACLSRHVLVIKLATARREKCREKRKKTNYLAAHHKSQPRHLVEELSARNMEGRSGGRY